MKDSCPCFDSARRASLRIRHLPDFAPSDMDHWRLNFA